MRFPYLTLLSYCQPASLELNALTWSPYRNKQRLKPISLDLKAGEFAAVVDPNGAGKTSLLRCLYRVNKPTHGEVLLDGQ